MFRVFSMFVILVALQTPVSITNAQELSPEFAPRAIKATKDAESGKITPGGTYTDAVSADLNLTPGRWLVMVTGTATHYNSAFKVCVNAECDMEWGNGTGNDWDVQSQTGIFFIPGDANTKVTLKVKCETGGCGVLNRQISAIAFKQ